MSFGWQQIWDKHHPPAPLEADFSGKTILVTGANVGLGLETVAHYVRLGAARIILASRSEDKGQRAKDEIEARYGRLDIISVWQLDMDHFESVKTFAARIETELPRLDIAVLNAGVQTAKYTVSPEGWEETLQVNTLSTALLAILLLRKLEQSKSPASMPHLHIVGSTRHWAVQASDIYGQPNLLQKFNSPKDFNHFKSYDISKLLIMYVVRELAARKTAEAGEPSIVINSSCPGAVQTQLGRDFDSLFFRVVKRIVFAIFTRTPEEGSRTFVHATLQGKEGQGGFYKNDQIQR